MARSQEITLPPPPHRNTEYRNFTDSTPALDIYWLPVTFLYLLNTRGTGKGGRKPQRTVSILHSFLNPQGILSVTATEKVNRLQRTHIMTKYKSN